MVKIDFYGETQEIEQIPEVYEDFISIAGALFSISDPEKYCFEYTHDNKNYTILNIESYNNLFLQGTKNTTVFIYVNFEETKYFLIKGEKDKKEEQNKKEEDKKDEDKKEEDIIFEDDNNEEQIINSNEKDNESDNDNNKIKIPPITKEKVINSIVQQVKEKMQKSRLLLQQKEEKERKEREEKAKREKQVQKGISDEINDLISNRLDNLKEELINESQIQLSKIVSESQINLQKVYESYNINDENEEKPKKELFKSLEQHPGIACNKCGMKPIIGNRYCCVYCNDINYCEKCEEENGLMHGHPFYKFKLRIE